MRWVYVSLVLLFLIACEGGTSTEPPPSHEPPPSQPGDSPLLTGYGTSSAFGDGPGSELCMVTTLADSGIGSLRSCVEDRVGPIDDPVPRRIEFLVEGSITLESDLRIRQPYLTIDGLSAPGIGITIEKTGGGEEGETRIQTWPSQGTCGHDVLVQGLRFKGVWSRLSTEHSNNAGNLDVDGENLPGCIRNVVIWRNTYIDAQDSAGGLWGSVEDVTFGYNLVAFSFHPQSISHSSGSSAQARKRISIHHNVYAYVHERIPNVRSAVEDLSLAQNIFHQWAAFGFPGGYATRFRCRDGACPTRINLIGNHWTSAGTALDRALEFEDDADPSQVYSSGNRFPGAETDDGMVAEPFPRLDSVAVVAQDRIIEDVIPFVGHPIRTPEEEGLIAEIIDIVRSGN